MAKSKQSIPRHAAKTGAAGAADNDGKKTAATAAPPIGEMLTSGTQTFVKRVRIILTNIAIKYTSATGEIMTYLSKGDMDLWTLLGKDAGKTGAKLIRSIVARAKLSPEIQIRIAELIDPDVVASFDIGAAKDGTRRGTVSKSSSADSSTSGTSSDDKKSHERSAKGKKKQKSKGKGKQKAKQGEKEKQKQKQKQKRKGRGSDGQPSSSAQSKRRKADKPGKGKRKRSSRSSSTAATRRSRARDPKRRSGRESSRGKRLSPRRGRPASPPRQSPPRRRPQSPPRQRRRQQSPAGWSRGDGGRGHRQNGNDRWQESGRSRRGDQFGYGAAAAWRQPQDNTARSRGGYDNSGWRNQQDNDEQSAAAGPRLNQNSATQPEHAGDAGVTVAAESYEDPSQRAAVVGVEQDTSSRFNRQTANTATKDIGGGRGRRGSGGSSRSSSRALTPIRRFDEENGDPKSDGAGPTNWQPAAAATDPNETVLFDFGDDELVPAAAASVAETKMSTQVSADVAGVATFSPIAAPMAVVKDWVVVVLDAASADIDKAVVEVGKKLRGKRKKTCIRFDGNPAYDMPMAEDDPHVQSGETSRAATAIATFDTKLSFACSGLQVTGPTKPRYIVVSVRRRGRLVRSDREFVHALRTYATAKRASGDAQMAVTHFAFVIVMDSQDSVGNAFVQKSTYDHVYQFLSFAAVPQPGNEADQDVDYEDDAA